MMMNTVQHSQMRDWLAVYDVILKDCESLAVVCRGIEPVVKTLHMLSINAAHAVTRMGNGEKHSVLASVVTDLQSGHHQLADCVEQIEYKVTHIEMKASTLVLNLSRSKSDVDPETVLVNLQRETAELMALVKQLEHLLTPIKQWSKKANYIAVMSTVDMDQSGDLYVFEDVALRLRAWAEGVDHLGKAPIQAIAVLKVGLSEQLEQLAPTRLTLLDCA